MKKYLPMLLMAIIMVLGMSFGTLSFAQTTPTLSCSTGSSSVNVNEVMVLTASGGTGTYFWSGQDLNVTNSSGTQFAVSYPNTGTFQVNVSSGGQTAMCNVIVSGTQSSSGNLSCSPAVQSVMLGQNATFSASGGNGEYSWSSPDLTIANPNGSGFTANYASIGLKTLSVTSNGLIATCATNVFSNVVSVPTTPGFPNTGGGYGQ